MNYEKTYKDALEKAKKELKTCGDLDCDAARQIFRFFPELKMNEDERIRKELIKYLQEHPNIPNGHYSLNDFYTWLEKQGEQNSIPKFKVGDWVVFNNDHDSVYQEEPAFTIDDFKPFDKVLVRGIFGWKIELFAIYHKGWSTPYECLGGSYDKCVPYNEETKCLLSTFIEYNGKYKTW